ncbi:MAG: hypothetical protein C0469_13765 [Cyanobacteria bacterium DS2.3.42]|nr:hypothetical protein [Cyanobacteria bacterium DS2.3.42]
MRRRRVPPSSVQNYPDIFFGVHSLAPLSQSPSGFQPVLDLRVRLSKSEKVNLVQCYVMLDMLQQLSTTVKTPLILT